MDSGRVHVHGARVSWDLILRHCAAIAATIEQQRVQGELLASQVNGLAAYAKQMQTREQQPTARIARPETCNGIEPKDCARLHDDAALHIGGMGGHAGVCSGCGLNPQPI